MRLHLAHSQEEVVDEKFGVRADGSKEVSEYDAVQPTIGVVRDDEDGAVGRDARCLLFAKSIADPKRLERIGEKTFRRAAAGGVVETVDRTNPGQSLKYRGDQAIGPSGPGVSNIFPELDKRFVVRAGLHAESCVFQVWGLVDDLKVALDRITRGSPFDSS